MEELSTGKSSLHRQNIVEIMKYSNSNNIMSQNLISVQDYFRSHSSNIFHLITDPNLHKFLCFEGGLCHLL